MPGGCSHCGWDPHRWWCTGNEEDYLRPGEPKIAPAWPRSYQVVDLRSRAEVDREIAIENQAIAAIEAKVR